MIRDMPKISYERSMNHNYMVLSRCDLFGSKDRAGNDYRTRMLLENRIPGLLPVTHRQIDGESRYYYEINSLQSLDRLYEKNEIRCGALKNLLSGCVRLFDRLEEYLLDGSQILIEPELIYINVEKMEPYFVCYPEYEGDVRQAFMEFIDGLLTRIDHTDEHAVMLGYQAYRYTRDPNYVISGIRHMIEQTVIKMAVDERAVQERPCPSDMGLPAGRYEDSCTDRAIDQRDSVAAEPVKRSCFPPFTGQTEDRGMDLEHKESYDRLHEGTKKTKDLIGGIGCLLIAACAGVILAGARSFGFPLSADHELYLYGAVTMALMASVLFFSCHIKKKRQLKKRQGLKAGACGSHDQQGTPAPGSENGHQRMQEDAFGSCVSGRSVPQGAMDERYAPVPRASDETVCLGDSIVEERMLYGRVDGREVSISLKKLPLTIGTHPDVSDVVLADTAVSKMHARFEEREGRVYVCDLNSTNGTVRNGVLLGVNQSVVVAPGDRIRFGRSSFTYC